MPTIPCDKNVTCAGCDDPPLLGVDAEAVDAIDFPVTVWRSVTPKLGVAWTRFEGQDTEFSTVSPTASQLLASENAFRNIVATWLEPGPAVVPGSPAVPPPEALVGQLPVTIFYNNPQSATALCPDGLPFTYLVPFGVFAGFNQAEVDEMALTYAQRAAQTQIICMSALSATVAPISQFFQATLTAIGITLTGFEASNTYAVVSGALPPGMTLSGAGTTATISGVPTVTGTYSFVVEVTDRQGNTMAKGYSIQVVGVFSQMQWAYTPQFPTLTPPGTGGATGNGDTLTVGLNIPAGDDVFGTATGTLNYTGPAHHANLQVTITAPWLIANVPTNTTVLNLLVNGVSIVSTNVDTSIYPNPGVFNFPFTLPAGSNIPVVLTFQAQFGVGGPISMNATFFLQQFAP